MPWLALFSDSWGVHDDALRTDGNRDAVLDDLAAFPAIGEGSPGRTLAKATAAVSAAAGREVVWTEHHDRRHGAESPRAALYRSSRRATSLAGAVGSKPIAKQTSETRSRGIDAALFGGARNKFLFLREKITRRDNRPPRSKNLLK